MRVDVIMPQLGESIAEGTIIKWCKQVGDKIEVDETLLEISTDKVDSEIPSPSSGEIVELLAKEGDIVEVGKVVAKIETSGDVEIEQSEIKIESEESVEESESEKPIEPIEEQETQLQKKITPLAKSIASKENISSDLLQSLSGSGYGGRITKKDVLDYLEKDQLKKESPLKEIKSEQKIEIEQPIYTFTGNVERVSMDHIRKSIAKHMVASAHTSPHVTSVHEVDITEIKEYIASVQEEFRKKEGVKLTLTSFIAQAVIKALKEFPIVNASIDGDDIVYHREVNLGIAVALENGLIVPVIRRADEFNLVGLTKAIFDIATRARSKKLSPDEVQGGTFSITNYGVFDTLIGTPIINQPQVAILGTGAAKQKPVVINGMIGIRWMMYLSLTYDHRLLDGAMSGKYLKKITELLENFNRDSID